MIMKIGSVAVKMAEKELTAEPLLLLGLSDSKHRLLGHLQADDASTFDVEFAEIKVDVEIP